MSIIYVNLFKFVMHTIFIIKFAKVGCNCISVQWTYVCEDGSYLPANGYWWNSGNNLI